MNYRRFRRIPFEADVILSIREKVFSGELLDVAMKGALVGFDEDLPITKNEHANLRITLPGSPVILDFQVELIHMEECQYGFRFLSEDLATLTHLRKLIELNTGDVETTRSELMSWLND